MSISHSIIKFPPSGKTTCDRSMYDKSMCDKSMCVISLCVIELFRVAGHNESKSASD